jgi:hypothetical protein
MGKSLGTAGEDGDRFHARTVSRHPLDRVPDYEVLMDGLVKPPKMIPRPIYRAVHSAGSMLHRFWPGRLTNPIFILGFPRSGTTILGELLAQCSRVHYLYEPIYIWSEVNPRLDTWGFRHPVDGGQLCWTWSDFASRDARRLAQWFHLELTASSRHRLVEKEPQNVFRIRWLDTIFPQAQFLHIIRDGRAAALSLVEIVEKWYAPRHWEYSWHYGKFRDYAATRPNLFDRLRYISESADNYPRALFVWLCCVIEGMQAGTELGPSRYMEVRYESLLTRPEWELTRIFDFLGEPLETRVVDYALANFRLDSLEKADPNPSLTQAIAGDLLEELGYVR